MSETAKSGQAGAGRLGLLERLRQALGLNGASVRDDIEDALEETKTSADFSPQERTMLKNVLGLHELRVEDVMVPRADIIAIQDSASLGEVLALFRTAGHSRFPVYHETLDDPRGMIHIRDFVDYLATSAEISRKGPEMRSKEPARVKEPARGNALSLSNVTKSSMGDGNIGEAGKAEAGAPLKGEASKETGAKPGTVKAANARPGGLDLSVPLSAAKILRPVLFVPPSMPALDLLIKMQASRTHMALVIDEYGGTDGLVSIEDIVETIVGDIEDEHDEAEGPSVTVSADGSVIANARATLEEVSEVLSGRISDLEDADAVDTVGGLVTSLAGRVPGRGEIVAGVDGLEFEILDADPRRIKRLRITRRDLSALPEEAPKTQEGEGKPEGGSKERQARSKAG